MCRPPHELASATLTLHLVQLHDRLTSFLCPAPSLPANNRTFPVSKIPPPPAIEPKTGKSQPWRKSSTCLFGVVHQGGDETYMVHIAFPSMMQNHISWRCFFLLLFFADPLCPSCNGVHHVNKAREYKDPKTLANPPPPLLIFGFSRASKRR